MQAHGLGAHVRQELGPDPLVVLVLQHLQVAGEGRERGLQLVGSVRYELGLGALNAALVGHVAQDGEGAVFEGGGPDLDDAVPGLGLGLGDGAAVAGLGQHLLQPDLEGQVRGLQELPARGFRKTAFSSLSTPTTASVMPSSMALPRSFSCLICSNAPFSEAAIALNVSPSEPTSSSTRVSIRSSKFPAASLSAATPRRLIRREIRVAAKYPANPARPSARAPASRAMCCMLSSAASTLLDVALGEELAEDDRRVVDHPAALVL